MNFKWPRVFQFMKNWKMKFKERKRKQAAAENFV